MSVRVLGVLLASFLIASCSNNTDMERNKEKGREGGSKRKKTKRNTTRGNKPEENTRGKNEKRIKKPEQP